MSDAAATAPSEQLDAIPRRINGRVDAIDGGHVFGWAWHSGKPSERLKIEALVDGRAVGSVTADRPRVDLRRNGVGDGSYAFDLQLPEGASDPASIELRAIAADGEMLSLKIPSDSERAAEAAVAVPLSRVLERLDILIAAQRQLLLAQRDASARTSTLAERVDSLTANGGLIEASVAAVTAAQTDVTERISAFEVFLARLDGTLATFDQRLTALQKMGSHEVKPLVIILATIAGFVIGAVVAGFAI
jgi:hypothetical protein